MKRFFSMAIVMMFVVLISAPMVLAGEAKISSSFRNTINTLDNDPNNTMETTINGATGWKWLYTSATSSSSTGFGQFGQVEQTSSYYISLAPASEISAGYGYQCVGFVKAASDDLANSSTSSWMQGEQVTPTILPADGTIVATFNSSGNYDFGHVGVFVAKIGNYMYILDQNWDGTDENPVGKIYLHVIPFTGNGGVNDAFSYYRVEI